MGPSPPHDKALSGRAIAQRLSRTGSFGLPLNLGAAIGLVAYVGGVPAGWVAVEPRIRYQRLLRARTPWLGRDEDRADEGVWVVSCLIVRKEFRGERLTYALAAATIEHARAAGALVIEAYPMVTEPGKEII